MTALVPTPGPGAFLFSEETMQETESLLEIARKRGEYSGKRLRSECPRLVEAALSLAGLGCLTQEEIAKALKISENSLKALYLAEESAVENYKESHAQSLRELARLSAGVIRRKLDDPEAMSETSVKDLSVVLGIVTEKAELLMGGVTQRIGVQHDVAPIERFNDYIAGLAQVQEMGLSAAESGQRGEQGAGSVAGEARTDEVSDVSPSTYREDAALATDDAAGGGDGGGGVAEFLPGGGEALDTEARHGDKGDL